MEKSYNYKQCQSLFGYAAEVHKRSGGICQLCDAGSTELNFNLWRQLTVEHIIGKSEGGYLSQIKEAVRKRFPELSNEEKVGLAHKIEGINTVTACSFCNSTTSRHRSDVNLGDFIVKSVGTDTDLLEQIAQKLETILKDKRQEVGWKLLSIQNEYENNIKPTLEITRRK